MSRIIDGKAISAQIKQEVADKVALMKKDGKEVCLAVIIVGEDPASKIYVANKKRACEQLGICSREYALSGEATQQEVIDLINKLNADSKVNGILCQLPLPKHMDESVVTGAIVPHKDVDGFHPVNAGKLLRGEEALLPCTPAGIIQMLERENIDIAGKSCVVIGRSNIVGKPAALLMLSKNATVTVCHSKTANLKEVCVGADILISAIGRPKFVTAEMVKQGAVVIDVGINRNDEGKVCGDVDYDAVSKKASAITPVPGGVGPMTIAMLMHNTLIAAQNQLKGEN